VEKMQSTELRFSKDKVFREKVCPNSGNIHFIAIGGIGMSGLAKILLEKGYKVSGSDIKSNAIIESLQSMGASVYIGHNHENISDCSLVVVSSAIKDDNPELIEAKKQNLHIIHRAQLLEFLMSGMCEPNKQTTIGVTGTHGKTTTSGMTAFIFEKSGLNPSFAVGGQLPHFEVNSKAGSGSCFISEVDESDGSIELYTPDITIVSNLEFDHADHYQAGFEQILETFNRFISGLQSNAKIIINTDDAGNNKLINKLPEIKFITYSSDCSHLLHNEADYRAETIQTVPNAKFNVFNRDKLLGEISLAVPGAHNVSNALAAVVAALEAGVEFSSISESLSSFTGMKRRFQTVGYKNGARIIDDYAHHPTEIQTTLKTARDIISATRKGRLVVVFQPHRFSRLANLWHDFVNSFKDADLVYICDVYSAGEEAIPGVSSAALAKEIAYTKALHIKGDIFNVANELVKEFKQDDIVFTMGAGTVTQLGKILLNL
jgi:UDP-N-acetylmuramate--alanine ligase